MSEQRANALIHEKSPYLLQHAHNPVDWLPWGDEAFARARALDRPILLSVGYSACHWCHVMERESFEDAETAALMNQHFVSIKVDREERPDIDQIYQHSVQMLTGQGGWPLTVFLTPEGKPFYGGTYFPSRDGFGRPSFRRLLLAIHEAWTSRRADVEANVRELMAGLARLNRIFGEDALTPEIPRDAARRLLQQMDPVHGGFLGAPKFPNPVSLCFLLGRSARAKDPAIADRVFFTLRRMARGGLYDQLGGGFHRYSVDERWEVPHFEKMLYDNAQLLRLYVAAWKYSGDPFFRAIADETTGYLLHEMRSPEGAFYASQDADSEGEEGRYFVWTPEEIERAAGGELSRVLCATYQVTPAGNFEGNRTVLNAREAREVALELGLSVEKLGRALAEGKKALLAAREKRPKPFRDEKILAAWNGLAIAALAASPQRVAQEAARRAAEFLLARMWQDGRLARSYAGGEARHEGILDDYAFVANGILSLYQATLDRRWLEWAVELAEAILDRFRAPGEPGFYRVEADTGLIERPRSIIDEAIPSGAGIACRVLLRLAAWTGLSRYEEPALATLASLARPMRESPLGFASMLDAVDGQLRGLREVVVAGRADDVRTRALLETSAQLADPDLLVAWFDPEGPEAGHNPLEALLRGKGLVNGHPAAYVCRAGTCGLPVTDPTDLKRLLESI
jgi:uncharacterized protein YyaL (SSP411 family)